MEIIEAKIGNRVVSLSISQVYYFRADGAYTRVLYDAGEVLILDSLNLLEERYGNKVLRVQRGVLINISYLEAIYESEYKCYALVKGVSERLPVSKRQLPNIRKKLSDVNAGKTVNDLRYDWLVSYIKKVGAVDVLNEQFVYKYIKQFNQSFIPRYAAPKCNQLNKDLSYLHKERVLDRFAVGTPSYLILRDYPKWVYRYIHYSSGLDFEQMDIKQVEDE